MQPDWMPVHTARGPTPRNSPVSPSVRKITRSPTIMLEVSNVAALDVFAIDGNGEADGCLVEKPLACAEDDDDDDDDDDDGEGDEGEDEDAAIGAELGGIIEALRDVANGNDVAGVEELGAICV